MPNSGSSWPSADSDVPAPVTITFTAGWASASVPADIKQAMLLYIADAIDIAGAGDLGQYTDTELKSRMLSGWRLNRW